MATIVSDTKDVQRGDMSAETLCELFRAWLTEQKFGGIHTIIFIAADEVGTHCATVRRNDIPLDEHIITSQTATLEMIEELAGYVTERGNNTVQ